MFVEGIRDSERGWRLEVPRPRPPSSEDSGRNSEGSPASFPACRGELSLPHPTWQKCTGLTPDSRDSGLSRLAAWLCRLAPQSVFPTLRLPIAPEIPRICAGTRDACLISMRLRARVLRSVLGCLLHQTRNSLRAECMNEPGHVPGLGEGLGTLPGLWSGPDMQGPRGGVGAWLEGGGH